MQNHEDFERDFLKDAIYLHEQVMELEMAIREEIVRNEAIIKVIKDDNSKGDLQKVRDINPARIYVGYDLPFEDDSTGNRCTKVMSRHSQDISTLSNAPQETTDH